MFPQRPAHALLTLMRPRHWVKNAFVFAPLLFTGLYSSPSACLAAAAAAAAFCLASSAVYILNDLQDLERDRQHPTKALTRPLAAGTVSQACARLLLVLLLVGTVAAALPAPKVLGIIALYLGINVAYSFGLKHIPVVDIFCVASGFVLRVEAGAVALDVPVSDWMLVTTGCLALYLAAVKRRQELASSGVEAREVLSRYSLSLIDRYAEHSATAALVFYGLFVTTTKPQLIPTVPMVLFGMFRYWYVVDQHRMGESPTDALLTDTPLLMTVAAWAGACAWTIQHTPGLAP